MNRITAARAEYMELYGARKDADCKLVDVDGGVSKQLGCCDRFEHEDGQPQQFRCGTCKYLKEKK